MTSIFTYIIQSLSRLFTNGFFHPILIFMLSLAGVAGALYIIKRVVGWRKWFSNV